MWTILKTESANDWLDFEPVTILHEYDRPTIFTSRGADGSLYLAYFCGKDTQTLRYLVAPFNELRQHELVTGKISLREVFDVPQLWIFDLNFNWEPVNCWEMTPRELPRHLLPKPGVMLFPDLPRVIRTKANSYESGASEQVWDCPPNPARNQSPRLADCS